MNLQCQKIILVALLSFNLINITFARDIGNVGKTIADIISPEIDNPPKETPPPLIEENKSAENEESAETVKEALLSMIRQVVKFYGTKQADLIPEDNSKNSSIEETVSVTDSAEDHINKTHETTEAPAEEDGIPKEPKEKTEKVSTDEEQISEKGEKSEKDFETYRTDLMKIEDDMSFGSDVLLNTKEQKINEILMMEKFNEIDEGFADQRNFLPRSNFLRMKDKIEKSKVFQIIKKIPKGSLLHAHDVGTVSQDYVLQNITYRPDLYACETDGKLELKFFKTPDKKCDWKLLSKLRETPEGEKEINEKIRKHMSMMTEKPEEAYPDGDRAWIKFQSLFEFLGSFMRYRPVYEDYYYQLMQENYDDKVLYIELRASLPKLYELDGKLYKPVDVVRIIKNVVNRFKTDYPDFIGVKIIYSKRRLISNTQLQKYLDTFKEIKEAYPTFVAGFDLVGQEEKGLPLRNFTKQLRTLENKYQTFFHAGETDWYGLSTDENLIDAVLLNTKRIGHGYALPKHPKVMELVKKKDIAIEVNPISNQILNLVADLRNHPASILFAENYAVVVCSDDPGLWGATGLSYDFYDAFMGIMSRRADLRALIQLGYNSIIYSAMSYEEKQKAFEVLNNQWLELAEELNINDYDTDGGNVLEE